MKILLKISLVLILATASATSAPLFPDLPEQHWARDAVSALAAKGLVEGYPDGTFKGDRSSSRWETAMVVARLLAKMEQDHLTFATKAELDEVRKLALALQNELEALGVRVDHLEESVDHIEQRVNELERITFYGSFEARVSFQNYSNRGQAQSDPSNPVLNYEALVGTINGAGGTLFQGPAAGVEFDPFAMGVFSVNNLKSGRPLANGTGLTAKALLGLNIKVSPDIDAGLELVAFSSQGDNVQDLYYGVSAPYLSNAFTAISTITGGLAGTQPTNHQPFTRMTLDNFWIHHKPSNVRLRAGALSEVNFDTLVYQKQFNPGAFGPRFLDSYGLQVTGENPIVEDESQTLSWEVLGTLLPDRNGGVNGASYFSTAWGGNLAYNFDRRRGRIKANFLRAANQASGGAVQQVGLIANANNNLINWVNPSGFFFNQLGGPNNDTGGLGSTGDIRPVPMPGLNNDGITGVPGQANFGNLGPQGQNSYGLSARYLWGGDLAPRILAEWARSDYTPNQNSGFSVSGNAYRFSGGATFFDSLEVDLEYLAVDPTYDPFLLQIPRVGGILFNGLRLGEGFMNQRGDLYNLHDTEIFPHNREGFRGKFKWDFSDDGAVLLRLGFLEQRRASLQDVRFSANSLGAGIPNSPVLGFSPGFTEPVFGGFSPNTFASDGANTLAVPLESPRGRSDFLAVTAQHKWYFDEDATRGVQLTASYNTTTFKRRSNLAALLPGPGGLSGEHVNNVDLNYSGWEIGVDYDLTETFTLNGGYGKYGIVGHYDPYGVYSNFAVQTQNTTFNNLHVEQQQPFIGFDYAISDSTHWDLVATYISTRDKVSPTVFGSPTTPANNNVFSPQSTLHPFSYHGLMINSSFNLNF